MAVEAVVSVVIHKLTNLLIEESDVFERVIDDVERVRVELRETQSILNYVEHKEHGDPSITGWVAEFLRIVYSVESSIVTFALAKTHLKRMGFFKKHAVVIANEFKLLCRGVPDAINYGRFKSTMTKFSTDLDEWKRRKHSLVQEALNSGSAHPMQLQAPRPWQDNPAYYAPKREEIQIIFEEEVKKLKTQLTDESKLSLQIISIFGDADIGKATHAKMILDEVKHKFSCHASVIAPADGSVPHLLEAILRRVTRSKDHDKCKREVELKTKLHEFLNDKTYLIVIIDIKNADLLKHVIADLPDRKNGSRVLITTGNEETASYADASSCYHFKPLEEEDGFKLFKRCLPASGERQLTGDAMNMDAVKKIIAKTCEGIPLRITMLAGMLSARHMEDEDWWKVFEKLRGIATKSPSSEFMAFCYNDLPFHLKPCFLYLGLFPKGYQIPVRRLFRLWLAEGFVKQSPGMLPEDIVEGYLEELVNRNMVVITKRKSDESPKKCRMHRVLHDIFLPKAVEIGLFHLHQKSDSKAAPQKSEETSKAAPQKSEENSKAAPQKSEETSKAAPQKSEEDSKAATTRRLVEYSNIKDFPTSNALDDLQSYISFNGRKKDMPAEEVGDFIKEITGSRGFGLLRVLDLEGVYRPRLPENLGKLFHLRYLGLRYTFLDRLPSSVGELLYLETMDIKYTHITALPSSIWKMKHLRHLCLNDIRLDISAQRPGHRSLTQLQTLWGLFVDEKNARKIGSTLKRMTNLRKLGLTIQSSSMTTTNTRTTTTTTITTTTTQSSTYEEIGLWISTLSSLQSLSLRSKDKMGKPSDLIIQPLAGLENLSQLHLLGHLRKSVDWYQFPTALKVLTLSVSHIEKDPMPTLSEMPSLIVLRLLAASYVGEEIHCPKDGFPALRVLKLWKLENLKTWTVEGQTMQKLQKLEIRCCQKLEASAFPMNLMDIKSFRKFVLTNMPQQFVSNIKNKKQHTKIEEK